MQEIKRRKPLVALLMSLVLPGFGQLYNGEVNKAIWLFIAFAFLTAPGIALLALYSPDPLLAPLLLLEFLATIGVWIYGMYDAWRQARGKDDYRLQAWQRSGLYVLVLIVCNIFALPMMTIYIRANLFEPFRIPSTSMQPSVQQGDFVMTDKRYNCRGCEHRIERGDVAVFMNPNNRTQLFIKRIIALPGDRVMIRGRSIEINGRPLTPAAAASDAIEVTESSEDGREWRVRWDPARPARGDVDLIVPPGQVYVIGDNRNNSIDSRDFATVPMPDIVGRARIVWFSYGPDGIRWSRLGTRLD